MNQIFEIGYYIFERIDSYRSVFNSLLSSIMTVCLWSDLRLYPTLQQSEWMLSLLKLTRVRCPRITFCISPNTDPLGKSIWYRCIVFFNLTSIFLVNIFFSQSSKHFMSVNRIRIFYRYISKNTFVKNPYWWSSCAENDKGSFPIVHTPVC